MIKLKIFFIIVLSVVTSLGVWAALGDKLPWRAIVAEVVATTVNTTTEAEAYDTVMTDTLPPLQEQLGNSITNPNSNIIDLHDPSIIEKNVEYDPTTNSYIITEKIGEEYFRTPTMMTFEEYLRWKNEQEQRDYFNKLSGINTGNSEVGRVDPIAKIDVKNSLLDRLFGGSTIDIRPQGNIDLTFGAGYTKTANPILPIRQQRQFIPFDFDMNINMNVTGKIGEKLNLTWNYNSQATFDFENPIKLQYNSANYNEDEIIRKIEAGNVSMPLRGSLIQGTQSLFGIKTEMQFGRLKLTALASQQKSRREEIKLQGGSQLSTFTIPADEYDENRHFFISHYNRNTFEGALNKLPVVNSLFKLTKVEVWVSTDRTTTTDPTNTDNKDIVALVDLAEYRQEDITNPNVQSFAPMSRNPDIFGNELPANSANDLYNQIITTPNIRSLDNAVAALTTAPYNFVQNRDFVKVHARRLQATEYTVNNDLGFISLNINLRPDQALAISYEYNYNGINYRVGEFGNDFQDTLQKNNIFFLKMLKGTAPRVDVPAWDLMMKNIYSIGAFQVSQQDFLLDVFYEDPGGGQKRFLPSSNLSGKPLLRVFNLDNLNFQNDPVPDGVFDFVPGVTINPQNGRVMFPVLEPFGSSLGAKIDDPNLRSRYVYQQLYDSTITRAREFPEFNRFTIRGSYRGTNSSEINLGRFNIPQESEQVYAGGALLRRGVDYEIDYNIGRIRILNESYANSGVPIRVTFEDNTLFGFQTRTMLGLRADYEVNKDFTIGGTYLHLFERPFTQKVNIGDDPINNRIVGLDVNYTKDAPWLTKFIDKLPLISTKAPSKITLTAETALLKPGHASAINQGDNQGSVYLDDFEGSASSLDLRQPTNGWYFSSVPQNEKFPESRLIDTTLSGVNRARLNWYRIDATLQGTSEQNPYTRRIEQKEVFPQLQLNPGENTNIFSFDLTYNPDERGAYNFDLPQGTAYSAGLTADGKLKAPKSRWAGMMRFLNSATDFESANYEYVEFWMMSPFIIDQNNPGDLYINLGSVSEDILRDSRTFFENSLPRPGSTAVTDTTSWGRVPQIQPITNAFDADNTVRQKQDVGLDGLNDNEERTFFSSYLATLQGALNPAAYQVAESDPSNDNFVYFNDANLPENTPTLSRYAKFNNPEGNSQPPSGNNVNSSTNIPDTEDLNGDKTAEETEAYFEYKIPLKPDGQGGIEWNNFITDTITGQFDQKFYRFKVPIDQFTAAYGGIQDFRSIRFMRIYMKDFERPITIRFATLSLVRNQWRRYRRNLVEEGPFTHPDDNNTLFDVNAVNIEQNSQRTPFNYVLPRGINRENQLGSYANTLQNEQSLTMTVCNLADGDSRAIFKTLNLDMRTFKELKMFVHAEERQDRIPDGDMSVFIRLGSDFTNNYYEYEVPLTMSKTENLPPSPLEDTYIDEVWKPSNEVNFSLSLLSDVKIKRNTTQTPLGQEFVITDPDRPQNSVKVKGNPNLGLVKGAMIGIRNRRSDDAAPHCAEIWVNELRVNGFDERGGFAALARVDMQLADLGVVAVSGNYSSIGWGTLEQKLAKRQREQVSQYDAATNLELGKLLPEKTAIRVPFYAQYSTTIRTPEFDPYDLDIRLKDKLNGQENSTTRDSIRRQAQDVIAIKSFNFTNVRKERVNKGDAKPMPWDIENFSATYAYSQTSKRNPIIELDVLDSYKGALSYDYTRQATYITPFKKILKKDKYLKLFTEFNFNPLPNSFGFDTQLNRQKSKTKYRFTGDDPELSTFYIKRFTWDRIYDLQWDLTKSLNITFAANNSSLIDELDSKGNDPRGINRGVENTKKYLNENLRSFGRTRNYTHQFNVNYNVPLKYIPLMDWITVRAQYGSTYGWSTANLNTDSLGNVIQNSQNRQINGDFNFEKLYNQWGYLKKINQGYNSNKGNSKKDKKAKDAANEVKEIASDEKPSGKESALEKGKEKIANNDPDNSGNNATGKDGKDAGNLAADSAGDAGNKKTKEKKKKSNEPSLMEHILLRPLMIIRKAKFTYTETFATIIPGFMPQSKALGMNNDFTAPGVDFIAGLQPTDAWFNKAVENNWMTQSIFLNQQVLQNHSQNIDGRVTLEPFNDFRLEVDAKRQVTESHSEFFKKRTPDTVFARLAPRDVGSFTVSYFAMNTLFKDDTESLLRLFQQYERNREIISRRLGTGDHIKDGPNYAAGFGRYQQDVLIPAFLAAYSGTSASKINLASDILNTIPRPNWKLSYGGLQKLIWFKNLFTSFNITHGYNSTLTINNFATDNDYLPNNPEYISPLSGNYFSRFEVPAVVINEQLAPLIGIDIRTKNEMSIRLDFKKSRTLNMSFIDYQLNETKATDYTIGAGYKLKNVKLPFIKDKKKKKKKKKKDGDNTPDKSKEQQGNDLDLKFDFSLRDDISLNRRLDQAGEGEPTRGNRAITFTPSAQYYLNKRLSLRLFMDYRKQIPKTSIGFPTTNIRGGVTVRFALQ
ncbi:MAG: cell surface protein SprA [Saprospiraceae bacterium]|nr:cell surface protein SprA [Saprospiraceae bacterium]MBP7680190.1 cell surface protein SprA [Saprospiraceae bacterium]